MKMDKVDVTIKNFLLVDCIEENVVPINHLYLHLVTWSSKDVKFISLEFF